MTNNYRDQLDILNPEHTRQTAHPRRKEFYQSRFPDPDMLVKVGRIEVDDFARAGRDGQGEGDEWEEDGGETHGCWLSLSR